MSATLKLSLKGNVSARAEASTLLKNPGDAVLVERGRPRLLVLACPCGCGDEIPINLDPRSGKAWRYYFTGTASITLFPSVWRDTGCESHFIIWRDRIWLFGLADAVMDYDGGWFDGSPSKELVLDHLHTDRFVHFSEIAEQIDAIPWDVLRICRSLAEKGKAIEAHGRKQRGRFKRV